MIDERIEDTVEEADEVVIDLSENEGDTPEESNNTETPVTGIETVVEEAVETEETEEEEKSEEPEETKTETEEEDSDDSKKVFGKRAEKRIKRLVAQKKELEEKLKAAEQDKASWHSQARKLENKNKDNELSAISNYIDKLESQEKQALSALKIAKENGNIDEEIIAQDTLASVKAETLVAQQYKARAESQIQKPNEQSSLDPVIETPKQPNQYAPTPDRKAVEWQKRNRWFGGTDTSDRIMSQAALVIHKELVDDGIIPNEDSDEYYNELDARIRSEFPEKFKQKNVNKVPTVVGGSRANPGSSKVKLSKTEVEMANRLGVDLKEYARQKQRQLKAGG